MCSSDCYFFFPRPGKPGGGPPNPGNFPRPGNPGSPGALHLANITTAAGGLPIRAGNTLVGAIGISGTPGAKGGGTADEGCAKAAIEKIAGGLK